MLLSSHWDVKLDALVCTVTDRAVTSVLCRSFVHHRLQDAPARVNKPEMGGVCKTADISKPEPVMF